SDQPAVAAPGSPGLTVRPPPRSPGRSALRSNAGWGVGVWVQPTGSREVGVAKQRRVGSRAGAPPRSPGRSALRSNAGWGVGVWVYLTDSPVAMVSHGPARQFQR